MSDIIFNRDGKFDIQLSAALIHERRLAEIFATGVFVTGKIELKSESWQWERTRNICVEFRNRGKPSGIATTEADVWVHELLRDQGTLGWMMFPIERLKELARQAFKAGRVRRNCGDDGQSDVVLIRLKDVLQ